MWLRCTTPAIISKELTGAKSVSQQQPPRPIEPGPSVGVYSALVSAPFVLFLLMLMIRPAALGWVPVAGGVASLGIYAVAVLFVWPVVIALIYLKHAERR